MNTVSTATSANNLAAADSGTKGEEVVDGEAGEGSNEIIEEITGRFITIINQFIMQQQLYNSNCHGDILFSSYL